MSSLKVRERIAERRRTFTRALAQQKGRQALWGIVIGMCAAILFLGLRGLGMLESLELRTFDWRMQATRHAAAGSGENVSLCFVDEASLKTMQGMGISWPWPRELYAGVLEFATRGGARAVLFDLFFSEDSTYGVADDEGFGAGIEQGPPTYFVLFASKHEAAMDDAKLQPVLEKSRIPLARLPHKIAPRAQSLQSLPVPEVIRAATGFGNAQAEPDEDGIYRRVPLTWKLGDSAIPQIALKVVSDLQGVQHIDWPLRSRLVMDGTSLPLDDQGNLIINYRGGIATYPTYSLAQVMIANQQIREGKTPDLDPNLLKDRVVIVGVAAPGLYDLKPMPLARVYPGPEVHATLIDSLIRHDFIIPLAWQARAAIVIALTLLLTLGLSRMQRFAHIIAWILVIAGSYTGLAVALFSQDIWMPLVGPLGALSVASFAVILRNYLTEGRKKHAIKKAFGQYLSPAVVGEIAMHPEAVKMGGEEQEVTIFFSDIANFTSTSEQMSPSELVQELCSYLTQVTRVITDHEGTLDKYIGDAVMAFWGAPLQIPDHAAQAALAALQIQQELTAFPQFATRIGMHTGTCVVGNIGSDLRFNYTAIGDAVNLASRLEGLNKAFGTRIMLSEATYDKAAHAIEARKIGRVRVKGRIAPISIYEPLARKGALSPDTVERMHLFANALECFFRADFSDARELLARLTEAEDAVVAYYLHLCEKYLITPPPEPFDGVIVFQEK